METTANLPIKSIVIIKGADARSKTTEINALAASIAQDGQLQPVIVEPHPNDEGKFVLLGGHRRFAAIKKLKHDTILALVKETEKPEDSDWRRLLDNIHRQDLSTYELAAALAGLKKAHKWSAAKTCRRYGSVDAEGKAQGALSESHVRNLTNAIEQCSDAVLKDWATGRINTDVVFKLKGYTKTQQDEHLPHVRNKRSEDARTYFESLDGGESGGGTGDGSGRGKKSSRPSAKLLGLAIHWAEIHASDETLKALHFANGTAKTIADRGYTFTKTWKPPKGDTMDE